MKYAGYFGLVLLSALSGCQWIGNMGEHMPVVGERCENWQCFTESGKQASEAKRRQREEAGSRALQPDAAIEPVQTAPVVPPVAPVKSAAPTPYDMTPEQLRALPPPSSPE